MSDGLDPAVFYQWNISCTRRTGKNGRSCRGWHLLDIVLEISTGYFLQIKYNAEADDSFTLDRAIYTMRNMCANRIKKHGPPRKQRKRESAKVTTCNKKGKCHVCNETGIRTRDRYHRKRSRKDTNKASKKWCSLHKTHLHEYSEWRSQQQQLNGNKDNNRNTRNGPSNGPHEATTTEMPHANTAINPVVQQQWKISRMLQLQY